MAFASPEPDHKKFTIVALGAILVVAATLRLYGLPQQGFMVYDDAMFVVVAKRSAQEFASIAERFQVPPALVETHQSYFRPGFIGLVRLSSHLVGWSPLTGAGVSAVFGVLTVGAVYGITRQFFAWPAALLATALLATSSWDIYFSRLALSNATATFFWTAGLYAWLRFSADRRRALVSPFMAGLFFGYAFTCHYSLLLYLSVGLACELWLAVRERAYRGTLLLVGGAVIPFFWFYGQYGSTVWEHILRQGQMEYSAPDFFYYLRLLWRHETLPLMVFSVVGAIRAVQTFRQRPLDREASLYALCFASLLLLSLQAAGGSARPRLMAPLLPLFAVLSGGAATLLMESGLVKRGQTVLWSAAFGLLLLAGLASNRGFFAWHSGFEAAVDYLHTRYPTGRYACAGWWPVCDFYSLGTQVTSVPQLETLTPRAEFLFVQSTDPLRTGAFSKVPGRLMAQIENPIDLDPRIIDEFAGVFPGEVPGAIRLYDLRPARRAAPNDTRAVAPPVTVPTDPNARDTFGTTPLIRAAADGHTAALRALLAKGAEVNARSQGDVTALMAAAFHGHTVTVAALVAAGADIQARAQGGGTALMAAAVTGHTATAAVLLAAGADLQAKRNDGATALMLAASSGHPATAAFLMKASSTSQKGVVPLLQALQHLNIPLSEAALIERAAQGDTQAVGVLLVARINPNAQDQWGTTALIAAAVNGHTAIVEALLAMGADVNMKNPPGETALLVAAVMGRTDTVAALVAAGADINAKRRPDGMTALILAAANGHTATVAALVAAGADLNASSRTGWTALMWAAQDGHTPIVEALLAQGADVNAKQADIQAGWSDDATALMLAAANGHLPTVQALLANGADVNANTRRGATALMGAAVDGHAAIVEILLAHGAEVNARQVNGWTALMGAAESGHVAIVQALLAKGADVQATYRKITTALKLAEERGHTTIVELLKQARAAGRA